MLRSKLSLSKRARESRPLSCEFSLADNAHSAIDEAHATWLFVPSGRRMVALLELVDCVLPTPSKSPAGSGGA